MGIQDNYDDAIDATASGEVFTAQPTGECTVTTVIPTTGGATFGLFVREKGGSWVKLHDYGSTAPIQDSRTIAAYEVKLEITSAAASGTAEAYFGVGGGA